MDDSHFPPTTGISPGMDPSIRGGGRWLVVLPAALAFVLRWVLLSPRFHAAQLTGLGAPHLRPGDDLVAAALFALIVLGVSWTAARWAGAWGALGAGLVLALAWPAQLLTAASTEVLLFAAAVVVGLALVSSQRRWSAAGWALWAACAILLVLPAVRREWLSPMPDGRLFRDPALLESWRRQVPLLTRPWFLGGSALFALGVTGLGLSRGKPSSATVATFLFASILLLWFAPWGWVLLLPIFAVFALFSGVTFFALPEAIRQRRWKAAAVILGALVILAGWGSWFSRTTPDELVAVESELRLERARGAIGRGLLDEAEDELGWLHQRIPEDRRVRLLDAEMLFARRRYHEAVLAFKKLRLENPKWRAPLLHSAWANYYDKSYRVATRTFERILKYDPRNASALIGLGACKIYQPKDLKEAKRLMEEGLALDDDNRDGHLNMAVLYVEKRNLNAEELKDFRMHLRRTMELDPQNAEVKTFVRRQGWYELIPPDQRTVTDARKAREAASSK